jgi:hypothetical protein
LVSRVGTGTANPRDLAQIRSALQVIPKLREVLTSGPELPTLLQRVAERLHTADDLRQRLEDALVDNPPQRMTEGGIFRDGYHPELDELRYIARHGKELIAALEAKERERTGIKNLRVGYNQVFGYYIEVTKANLHLVPRDYIRKQTLTDVERFVTPELKQLESKVLGAEERIGQLEYQLFVELRQEVAQRSSELLETARAIAELDVLATLAADFVQCLNCAADAPSDFLCVQLFPLAQPNEGDSSWLHESEGVNDCHLTQLAFDLFPLPQLLQLPVEFFVSLRSNALEALFIFSNCHNQSVPLQSQRVTDRNLNFEHPKPPRFCEFAICLTNFVAGLGCLNRLRANSNFALQTF